MSNKESFLRQVKPGQRYCFSDFDRTITIDSNSFLIACNEFGLVPDGQAQAVYESDLPADQKLGAIAACISPTVTAQTAARTGLPEGAPHTRETLVRTGQAIGDYLVENHLIYPEALTFFERYIQEMDGNVVILTASPEPLIEGAMQSIVAKTGGAVPKDKLTVIGSTLSLSPQGVTLAENLRGEGKNEVVVRTKRIAGIAAAEVGLGDRPDESDKFVHQCTYSVTINAKDQAGAREAWSRLYERISAGRSREKG